MYVKQQKRSSVEVSILIKVRDCFIDGVLNGRTYFPSCEYMQCLSYLSQTHHHYHKPLWALRGFPLFPLTTCEERFQQVLCAVNHLPSEISRWTALRITAWGG